MKELIYLCFGTSCLSLFLDMCFQEGMILHGYYKRIERLPLILFKPLGGCSYCFGTWIYLIAFLLLQSVLAYNSFILALYGILGIGINYVFIKAIEKI